jgi:hypothetical protein
VKGLKSVVERFAVDKPKILTSAGGKGKGGRGAWKERLKNSSLKGGVVLDAEETAEGLKEVVELARQAGEKGSLDAWLLLGDIYLVRTLPSPFSPSKQSLIAFFLLQTGHLTLPANSTAAHEAYTHASEEHGSPDAQYKLGFLYGSNFGGAVGDLEGQGQQGSVRSPPLFSPIFSKRFYLAKTRFGRLSSTTPSPPSEGMFLLR